MATVALSAIAGPGLAGKWTRAAAQQTLDARIKPDSLRVQIPASDVPDSAAAPAMKPEPAPEVTG